MKEHSCPLYNYRLISKHSELSTIGGICCDSVTGCMGVL